MSTIRLYLPDYLYKMARQLADKENISINQLITLALAEKISAPTTEDYLKERAARGDRDKFLAAMAKVADIEPEEDDRL
jgi:hypothetical protein